MRQQNEANEAGMNKTGFVNLECTLETFQACYKISQLQSSSRSGILCHKLERFLLKGAALIPT